MQGGGDSCYNCCRPGIRMNQDLRDKAEENEYMNRIVKEYNDQGCLLFSETYPGAYTRAPLAAEALAKFDEEIQLYCRWAGIVASTEKHIIIQEKYSPDLHIEDADSDVIFASERQPLSQEDFQALNSLVLQSAQDFQSLYDSIPDKDVTSLKGRKCFYGDVPITAREMYNHTSGVNLYYFNEIGVKLDSNPDILTGRLLGFEKIEGVRDFLTQPVIRGSYGEYWSLAKVLRRFLWHDRIHAKAMFNMATTIWGEQSANPYYFQERSFSG